MNPEVLIFVGAISRSRPLPQATLRDRAQIPLLLHRAGQREPNSLTYSVHLNQKTHHREQYESGFPLAQMLRFGRRIHFHPSKLGAKLLEKTFKIIRFAARN